MDKPTYRIDRITDLLQVPADRREQCLNDLLYALDCLEFSGLTSEDGVFTWIDDGLPGVEMLGKDGAVHMNFEMTKPTA